MKTLYRRASESGVVALWVFHFLLCAFRQNTGGGGGRGGGGGGGGGRNAGADHNIHACSFEFGCIFLVWKLTEGISLTCIITKFLSPALPSQL
jgi:hypothetical protein